MTASPASLDALAARRPELVALGASAGGFDAFMQLLQTLPSGYGLPVVALLHLPPDHESRLAEVFGLRSRVPVSEAASGVAIAPGHVYFAPPGYHLLVEQDRSFSLSCDPPQNFSRPSIDVLFETCADAYGPALAAALLTGANEDGALGLATVAARGGTTIVQDPAQAPYPAMPRSALKRMKPDAVLRLEDLSELMMQWGTTA
ncbi:chemotaxis protein CheB [Ramlibacter sp.]|uniref:chemotaxis protein CheB n=1 Tax=Ramlibacter sp. TaxID=1917967 RepID=UPI003D124323